MTLKVLSTKTLEEKSMAYANAQDMDIMCMDFIQTTPIPYDDSEVNWNAVDALVFTSSNAVRYFFETPGNIDIAASKTIFSLSGKTAAEFASYKVAPTYTSTNASFLCDAIVGIRGVKSVVHICGNLKLGTVESRLSATGIQYKPLTVYRTSFVDTKPLKDRFDVIMFYSPSGVESFVLKNNLDEDVIYCCVGVTTAEALKERMGNLKILIPESPLPEAMIDTISRHIKTRQVTTWPN